MQLPPVPKTPSWLLALQFEANIFGCMDAITQRYGDMVTVMFGSTPTIYVSNPSAIKEIFTRGKEIVARGALNKEEFALFTGEQGVLQLDGAHHKNRRKLLMSAFHGTRMQACGQHICELTEKIMAKQSIGKPFLAYPMLEQITLAIGIKVVMGLRQGERYEKVKELFATVFKHELSSTMQLVAKLPFWEWDLGRWSPQGNLLYLRKELFQLLYAEVQERRKQCKQLDSSPTDILSDLVLATDDTGEPISDEEIRDLLISPIGATQGASATAIAWALYWIHSLPHVRDRLLAELNGMGENPDIPTILALPYLNAVCNEVLRIYPTQLFSFPRIVESPVEIMGYKLSPGTIVIVNIYSTHQREDLYPETKQFQPERFLKQQFSNYEFLPFGGGSRACIGGAFALFTMKLVLATILLRYQLNLVKLQPEKPKFDGLLCYPGSGVKMIMQSRYQHKKQS
ncbi:MAG: cytochrome P450 [Cyanomargarita calcarea GSE-NOS-MK-12-04C]|jgi:cytochrome P450|uniref:Cytochrome P450 n=1 Tax=Cyanomargarita calcarea GSE-NOS-MK-12-04C TaxID=2839659 RepID=A0A951UR29_9CYAN|nr:cytochrome P450 [Cyanomargarita calcarea GSE-NOS-MK-12-04C]